MAFRNLVELTRLNEGAGKLSRPLENYCDQERIYNFDGPRGIQRFEKIVKAIGYRNLDEFWGDNPGAFEALVTWIGSQGSPEWLESLKSNMNDFVPDED
jgi:hypothetical protein